MRSRSRRAFSAHAYSFLPTSPQRVLVDACVTLVTLTLTYDLESDTLTLTLHCDLESWLHTELWRW